MFNNNAVRLALASGLFALFLSACASEKDEGGSVPVGKDSETKQPVTLKFFINAAYLNDDEVNIALIEPLKRKYPYIQLDIIRPTKDVTLETMVASNDIPDLHISWNGALGYLMDMGIVDDLEPLMKKEQFDLSRFDVSAIDGMKNEAQNGHLYGLPYAINFQLMYYNKDLFDSAGVPYPTDGMNWDQAIDLGKTIGGKLGAPYKGLDVNFKEMAFQLSLPYVDAATKKSSLLDERWKKVFDTANRALKSSPDSDGSASFVNRNVAMWAFKNRNSSLKQPSEQGMNWDVVEFPSFDEKPGVISQVDAHVVYMSPTSKHKEDALKVMEVLTSDDVQQKLSRIGKLPALNNKTIISQYAADIPYLKNKNWNGVFQGKFGLPPKRLLDDPNIMAAADKAFDDYSKGVADMNTALRRAAEEIDQVLKDKLK